MPEKRIKDLMLDLGTLERISPHTQVAEAVKALHEKQQNLCPPFLLLVDEVENKEEILGTLSMDDVLGHMGSSTEPMDELPIFWQGQFQQECEGVLQRRASEIMSPVTLVIHETGTLMEAVHLMNSGRVHCLPVVREKSVVGIVLKEDLFREVFEAAETETGFSKDAP
jgi:CBS domain-containing protein